jgi:DNA primase
MNFLLPHIRRMPDPIAREQFAANVADGLKISESLLRDELRKAALRRRDHIEVQTTSLTGVEKVLLRALAVIDPENEQARRLAAQAIGSQPAWFEHLGTFPAMQALAGRQASDPMDVVEDSVQRGLLAEALLHETKPPSETEVQGTLDEMQYKWFDKQYLDVEALMKEAHNRGDKAEEVRLAQQRLMLNRDRSALSKGRTSPI